VAAVVLSACGGGDDEEITGGGTTAGTAAAALTCDTSKCVAGAVEAPTSAQLTAYAGTYNGDERKYGPNPGDPFVKSASAALVLGADGKSATKALPMP
jgi:hypothetical protein